MNGESACEGGVRSANSCVIVYQRQHSRVRTCTAVGANMPALCLDISSEIAEESVHFRVRLRVTMYQHLCICL